MDVYLENVVVGGVNLGTDGNEDRALAWHRVWLCWDSQSPWKGVSGFPWILLKRLKLSNVMISEIVKDLSTEFRATNSNANVQCDEYKCHLRNYTKLEHY